MRRLEFDLRRSGAELGGYSGGIVLSDEEGSISFVSGNSAKVRDRHYVCVNYRTFDLTCDREDFPDLTRETPIAKWYIAAMTVLLSKLGPIEFIGLVDTLFENGKDVGANEARAEIRHALRDK
jgi:hypothetical protein